MSEQPSPGDWIGRLVDKRFPLFEWLGAAESGQVFRTELPGPMAQKAVIRIIPADEEGAQAQFDDWVLAASLSHPNLLHIFDTGHGTIDESEIHYVVMELPEESLSDVLPARALSPPEAADLLSPALSALDYLHSRGLVHGHVNPDHLLVIGDTLKLSTDNLQQTGQMHRQPQRLRIYDAPETAHGVLSSASDVWSLGVTLVEALTQHPPQAAGGDPDVPASVPEPFAEIARRCLRVDPLNRAALDELEALLNPPVAEPAANVPPEAAHPVSPDSVPTEQFAEPTQPEPKRNLWEPASRKPAFVPIPIDEARPQRRPIPPATADSQRPRLSMPVILAAVLVLIVIVAAVVMRSRNAGPAHETPTASNSEIVPAPQPPAQDASQAPTPAVPKAKPSAPPQAPPKAATQAATPQATPLPAPGQAARQPAPQAAPTPATGSNEKAAVAQRVMPEVLEKASRTISGKVTVKVRVQVDATGAVSDASFDSEGPSRYFSKVAMEASRKWRFEPAHVDGNAAPSEWVLRYDFRRDGTEVTPTEVKP